MAFDPGNERSVSYIDGDKEEWSDNDVVTSENGYTLSIKYDERYVYFYVNKN